MDSPPPNYCPARPKKRRPTSTRDRAEGSISASRIDFSKDRPVTGVDHEVPMEIDVSSPVSSTSRNSHEHGTSHQAKMGKLPLQAKEPTEHILALLGSELQPKHLHDLKDLLNEACKYAPIEAIASYGDFRGYDMMQRAVIAGCGDFVEFLLIRGYHISNLNRNCTNPLHLACKLGNSHIVRLLIDYGAEISELSTACYPPLHPSLAQVTLCCMGNSKTSPLGMAVMHDHLGVVKNITNHAPNKAPAVNFDILVLACRYKAAKCLEFFADLIPELCTVRDRSGQSLLSLAFAKSEECGVALLKSNSICWPAEILTNANSKQDSVLHIMYRGDACENFFDTTKLVFSKGFPKEGMDTKDRNGNTPLQLLMKQVGRKVAMPQHPKMTDLKDLWERNQNDKDSQLYATIRFLVQEGANIHTKNYLGEGLLHHLLQDCFHRRWFSMRANYYHGLLPEIIRVAELLMHSGINLNDSSDLVSSPMTWFTDILCSMEINEVETTWPELLFAFRLFCRFGADPNLEDEKGISNISVILTAVNRWMGQCVTSPTETDKAYQLLYRMQELFDLFFKHGLEPTRELVAHSIKQMAMLCNIWLHDVRLFAGIRDLLATFFRYGINPNYIQLVSEVQEEPGVPCPLNAQFYLARALMIHHDNDGMLSFFSLFEQTLEQESLNRLIRILSTILAANFGETGGVSYTKSTHTLWIKSHNSRPLKVLSKICINSCLSWQLEKKIQLLPLPQLMKQYLLTFADPCSGF